MELRYDAAFAMQNRVLRTLPLDGVPVFHSSSTRFWTPHSGRTFLPNDRAALGFPKSDRDFLGGWCAQASDRYARIGVRRITIMQRSIITALQSQSVDPLVEDESIPDFDAFMEAQSLDGAQRTLCFKPLDTVKLVKSLHGQPELTFRNPEEPEDDDVLKDTKKPFTQFSERTDDGKATQKPAQLLWERIPKRARQPFNLVTTCAC